MTPRRRQIPLPLVSHWVNNVRRVVETELGELDADLVHCASMVATELAENVVRYGACDAGTESGLIDIEIRDGALEIRSINGASEAQAAFVLKAIETMQERSAESLYLERLQTMVDDASDRFSQLGLIRIAYEGGFALSAKYEGSALWITARREVS